jgi:hypothetical protein
MPTIKAPYRGALKGAPVEEFSDGLREQLRGLCPKGVDGDHFAALRAKLQILHPGDEKAAERAFADIFVEQVLASARWAKSALHAQQAESTRTELRAERDDLLKQLRTTEQKLRTLSPDLDRLLGADADPLGLADATKALLLNVEQAGERVGTLPRALKLRDKEHDVAVEMAIRVLRVTERWGVEPAATSDEYAPDGSVAVQIVKAIGDDIGVVLSVSTWRDTISKAKKAAPDLR